MKNKCPIFSSYIIYIILLYTYSYFYLIITKYCSIIIMYNCVDYILWEISLKLTGVYLKTIGNSKWEILHDV